MIFYHCKQVAELWHALRRRAGILTCQNAFIDQGYMYFIAQKPVLDVELCLIFF